MIAFVARAAGSSSLHGPRLVGHPDRRSPKRHPHRIGYWGPMVSQNVSRKPVYFVFRWVQFSRSALLKSVSRRNRKLVCNSPSPDLGYDCLSHPAKLVADGSARHSQE